MARVTVEDCNVEKFELVILAAQRAKDIHAGAAVTVPLENDKKTVLALREIAANNVKIDELRHRFINSLHPQSALSTLDNEFDSVDKDVNEEFVVDESDFALTEEQMHVEDDSAMFFEDIDLSEEEKH